MGTISHGGCTEAMGSSGGGGGGSGDVAGPSSSVDNRIARFDGTTGKALQDVVDGPTLEDNGQMLVPDLGSSSLPSIASDDDPDTGLRLRNANVHVVVGGTIQMQVSGSQIIFADRLSINAELRGSPVSTKSTSTTLGADATFVPVDTSGGAIAVTLGTSYLSGIIKFIYNVGGSANNCTITAGGSETINGAATLVMSATDWGVILIKGPGTDWRVMANA